jgi:phosphoribosylglycinamide formyltransferase-1
MSPKILVACNSRGRMLDICLSQSEMKGRVWGLLSDCESGSVGVAKKHSLDIVLPDPSDPDRYNDNILSMCEENNVDYIISTGYTRIFKGELLTAYKGRILNTHFSLLPAFPGHRNSDWTANKHPPRAIFARAIAYGARIIGNTVHLVDNSIDGGYPVMQSCMAVPYEQELSFTRHRLFIQECQCLMQSIVWLSEDRLNIDLDGRPSIRGAAFSADPTFSPAIEREWIANFAPSIGV